MGFVDIQRAFEMSSLLGSSFLAGYINSTVFATSNRSRRTCACRKPQVADLELQVVAGPAVVVTNPEALLSEPKKEVAKRRQGMIKKEVGRSVETNMLETSSWLP